MLLIPCLFIVARCIASLDMRRYRFINSNASINIGTKRLTISKFMFIMLSTATKGVSKSSKSEGFFLINGIINTGFFFNFEDNSIIDYLWTVLLILNTEVTPVISPDSTRSRNKEQELAYFG
jgi:hypothetical protein